MFAWVSAAAFFWLKILSFCITSLLALLGLLFEFKNQHTHRLTKWGRINLCGLIAAFIVGIASQKIEDDRKQNTDVENAAEMKSLIDGDQATLTQLSQVLTKNDALIESARKSLLAEAKTDADTQQTLTAARRSLEAIGDTISVRYTLVLGLTDDELAFYRSSLRNHRGERTRETGVTLDARAATFAPDSQVIPSDGRFRTSSINLEFPFKLSFDHKRPGTGQSAADTKNRDLRIPRERDFVVYAYDGEQTHASHPSDPDKTGIRLFFQSEDTGILMLSAYTNTFRRETSPGWLSTKDFEGSYLSVLDASPHDTLCGLKLEIGNRALVMNMKNALHENGEYFYRLPTSMSQTHEEVLKSKQEEESCIKRLLPHAP